MGDLGRLLVYVEGVIDTSNSKQLVKHCWRLEAGVEVEFELMMGEKVAVVPASYERK